MKTISKLGKIPDKYLKLIIGYKEAGFLPRQIRSNMSTYHDFMIPICHIRKAIKHKRANDIREEALKKKTKKKTVKKQKSTKQSKQFEYKVIYLHHLTGVQNELNKLGRKQWELLSVVRENNGNTTLFLKREK